MMLSILIPTYNREPFLIKNIRLLSDYIRKGNLQAEIEIIISNNHSNDNTDRSIKLFQRNNSDILIHYFSQKENIGLEKNALFVLSKAEGEYVMFLGDDDYVEFEYLIECLKYIKTNKGELNCIIPANVPINEQGQRLPGGRDIKLPTKKFKRGFKNCLRNSWRGHQLSGLILKKDNLYNEYKKNNVNNIYLFIFFVAYSGYKGNTIHLTDYPVKVTAASQANKDWNYGDDGLINEIFDNYKKLPVTYLQKTLLELKHYWMQDWRLWMYKSKGNSAFYKAFLNIWLSQNSTFLFKITFPIVFFIQIVKKIAIRIFHVIHS